MTQNDAPPQVDVFGKTHVGNVRRVNEDQFFIAALQKAMDVRQTSVSHTAVFDRLKRYEAHLLVVADGVGGAGGGDRASDTAVQALVDHLARTTGCYFNYDVEREQEFLEQLERAVERSHERVQQEYGSGGGGPATTLTTLTLVWPRAYIVHVGDSRCYYQRAHMLRQITRDQTMAELAIDQGAMDERHAQEAGLHNVLSSAVGFDIAPSISLVDLEPNDTVLLCTDGLIKHVSDGDSASILGSSHSAEDGCTRLVDAALDAGGTDNVTVIVARILPSQV